MRVLFSNPPWWVGHVTQPSANGASQTIWRGGVRAGSRWPFTFHMRSSPDRFVFGDYLPYPFFMGYAATYVARRCGVETVMRDSVALRESYESYFAYLDANRFDYLFIESATPSWEHDGELIRRIHQRHPSMRIVLTGPIASIGQRILADHPVHACIRGEYEKGAARVLDGAEGLIDFDLLTTEEMNAAPFPHMDEVIAHRYYDGTPSGQIYPHAHVWSSRGCPFKCIFCVWPAAMTNNDPDGESKRTVRYYSADYMEAHISELVTRYNYRSIYFDDDTFNLGTRHTVRMCEVMSRIKVPWSAMCRADTVGIDTWRMMRDAGCFGVKLGFESGNQSVVDKIVNKHLNLDYARQVVREIKRLGMTVHGTFTFGLPGETPEQMADTRAYIQSLPFDSVQESGCAEIEGTPLHTLSTSGTLKAYEGAHIDGSYRRETDGNRKFQNLSEQLRAN